MANYYPLIAKAVAGLENNTGEARRTLYERARNALVTQLRSVTPALSETDITRERLALEQAIRKVEAEAARRARGGAPPPMRPSRVPWQPPPVKPADTAGAAEAAPAAMGETPAPAAEAKPAEALQEPWGDAAPAEPAPEPEESRPPPRPAFRSWFGREAQPPASREGPSVRPSMPRFAERSEAPLARETAKAESPARPPWPPRPSEPVSTEQEVEPEAALEPEPGALGFLRRRSRPRVDERGDEEAAPPFLPTEEEAPEQEESAAFGGIRSLLSSKRFMAVAAALVIVLGLSGIIFWQWSNIAGLFAGRDTVATPATQPASPSSRTKFTDRIGAPTTPSIRPQETPSAVQRVVLYEEDASNPSGKRFVGTANWRTESVAAGPGQASDATVRADIEIPEAKLTVKFSLRRNSDKALPASHTIEIAFTLSPDFPNGGISNIPGILMKQAEQTRGVPLAGLSVKVTTGFFLIGLSNAEADVQRNIQLLKERSWFDVPLVYNNNRRAILAIEKGSSGERAFTDAFAAWGE